MNGETSDVESAKQPQAANEAAAAQNDDEMDSSLGTVRLITHLSMMKNEESPLLGLSKSKPSKKPSAKEQTIRSGLLAAWSKYETKIAEHPLLTKSVTAGVLTFLGEAISQLVSHPGHLYPSQALHFFLLGLLFQGPVTHYFYLVLDGRLPPTVSPWTWTTLGKVLIDQLVFGPAFLVGLFLFLDLLDGRTVFEMAKHLAEDFWSTLCDNWRLWVPATLINHAAVAPQYRVLYNNMVFFVWSIILGMLFHRD